MHLSPEPVIWDQISAEC
uniref:Uncharacterized protein n=1 Tax=Anguilla anguilla TaxID=7936 RepID=A0A0E9PVJ6_ANGAN